MVQAIMAAMCQGTKSLRDTGAVWLGLSIIIVGTKLKSPFSNIRAVTFKLCSHWACTGANRLDFQLTCVAKFP
jgi:hypothetical protein